MAAIERLLKKPGDMLPAARQYHPQAVKILVGGSGRAIDFDLLQDVAKLGRRKTCTDDRTMQVRAELPDAGAAHLGIQPIRPAIGITVGRYCVLYDQVRRRRWRHEGCRL